MLTSVKNYISTPAAFFTDPSLTGSAASILSLIRHTSYSKTFDLKASYRDLSVLFQRSRATVARAISMIKENEHVTVRKNEGASVYEYRNIESNIQYYRSEYWFFNSKIHFRFITRKKSEDGNDVGIEVREEDRPLKNNEIRILTYMYSCMVGEKKVKTLKATEKKIAERCGVSLRSAQMAISALVAANLIKRKAKGWGWNKATEYTIVTKVFAGYRAQSKTPGAANFVPKSPSKPTPSALDYAFERKRYYEVRREAAKKRADDVLATLERSDAFREISRRYNAAKIDLARAKAFSSQNIGDLESKYEALRIERRALIEQLGYKEEDIEVKYVCPICQDSGFRSDGRSCNCADNFIVMD